MQTPKFGDSAGAARHYDEGRVDGSGRTPRSNKLRRLFWNFPGGWPGLGLLLLRLALGAAAILHGRYYFAGPAAASIAAGLVGWAAVISGVLLIAGIGTPLVACLLAAGLAAGLLGWLPAAIPNVIEGQLLILATAVAVALLGPGGFSVDARLFGRREIIIPTSLPDH